MEEQLEQLGQLEQLEQLGQLEQLMVVVLLSDTIVIPIEVQFCPKHYEK